jgi:hypothetical protein
LDAEILAVDSLHGLLFGIELAAAIEEGGAGGTLDGEGKHHANGDETVDGLFAAGDKLRVEVGGDVFVEDLAFSHG